MTTVRHETNDHRFVADVEGGMAELEYTLDGKVASFVHTLVPKPSRGQDVGTALVEAALEWARAEGMKVVPACPFVASYVESHPDAQDLVA